MIGGGKLGTYLTIEDKEPFNFIFKEIENEEELNKLLGDYKRNYTSVVLLPFKPINPKLNVTELYSLNPTVTTLTTPKPTVTTLTTPKPTVTTLTTAKPTVKQGFGNGIPKPEPLPNPYKSQYDQGTQSQPQTSQPKYQPQNNFPIGSPTFGTSTSAVMPPRFVGTVGAGGKSRIRRQTKKRIKHRVTRKRNKGRNIKRYTKYHVVSRKPKSRRRKH